MPALPDSPLECETFTTGSNDTAAYAEKANSEIPASRNEGNNLAVFRVYMLILSFLREFRLVDPQRA
jgi:hypothetical protein